MSAVAPPGGMTYRGPWVACEWNHGWRDSRVTPDCLQCEPTEATVTSPAACTVTTKAGRPCKGTPTEATGFCVGHSKTLAVHVESLVSA